MSLPVAISEKQLVFDTLPALKVCRYYGQSAHPNIYSYGRMYFLEDNLELALYAFEREPDSESCVEFYMGRDKNNLINIKLYPDSCEYLLCKNGNWQQVKGMSPVRFASADEQGWFWGARMMVLPSTLQEAGINAVPGAEFSAAVVKSRRDEAAFGISSNLPVCGKTDFDNFSNFITVTY